MSTTEEKNVEEINNIEETEEIQELEITIKEEEISKEEESSEEELPTTEEKVEHEEDDEDEDKEGDYFTYMLNADNSVFILALEITEAEAKEEHEEDVSILYAKMDTLPESTYGAYKKVGTDIVADEEKNLKLKQEIRYGKVAKLFADKNIAIKAIAINKPEITRYSFESEEKYNSYVNEQYLSYAQQYENAKKGFFSDAENKLIIQKYEFAAKAMAPINKLSNDVRAKLMELIAKDDENYKKVYEAVDNFSISMQDVVSGKLDEKLKEFKKIIGL